MKKLFTLLSLVLALSSYSALALTSIEEITEGSTYSITELQALMAANNQLAELEPSVVIFDNGSQIISVAASHLTPGNLNFDPAVLADWAFNNGDLECPFAQVVADENTGELSLVNLPSSESVLDYLTTNEGVELNLSTFTFPVTITLSNTSGTQIMSRQVFEATRPKAIVPYNNDGNFKLISVSGPFKSLKVLVK